jgi:hypothetical protein
MPHGLGVRSVCSRGVMRKGAARRLARGEKEAADRDGHRRAGLDERGFLWYTKCVETHVERRLQRTAQHLSTTGPALAQDAEVTSALSALYGTGSFGIASESLVELEARYLGDLARL